MCLVGIKEDKSRLLEGEFSCHVALPLAALSKV